MDTKALRDVAEERRRQVQGEGWTYEHDDQHAYAEMAAAACCYAMQTVEFYHHPAQAEWRSYQTEDPSGPVRWPWDRDWWKPTSRRRDLVKAGALILAEIERLDRIEEEAGE